MAVHSGNVFALLLTCLFLKEPSLTQALPSTILQPTGHQEVTDHVTALTLRAETNTLYATWQLLEPSGSVQWFDIRWYAVNRWGSGPPQYEGQCFVEASLEGGMVTSGHCKHTLPWPECSQYLVTVTPLDSNSSTIGTRAERRTYTDPKVYTKMTPECHVEAGPENPALSVSWWKASACSEYTVSWTGTLNKLEADHGEITTRNNSLLIEDVAPGVQYKVQVSVSVNGVLMTETCSVMIPSTDKAARPGIPTEIATLGQGTSVGLGSTVVSVAKTSITESSEIPAQTTIAEVKQVKSSQADNKQFIVVFIALVIILIMITWINHYSELCCKTDRSNKTVSPTVPVKDVTRLNAVEETTLVTVFNEHQEDSDNLTQDEDKRNSVAASLLQHEYDYPVLTDEVRRNILPDLLMQ